MNMGYPTSINPGRGPRQYLTPFERRLRAFNPRRKADDDVIWPLIDTEADYEQIFGQRGFHRGPLEERIGSVGDTMEAWTVVTRVSKENFARYEDFYLKHVLPLIERFGGAKVRVRDSTRFYYVEARMPNKKAPMNGLGAVIDDAMNGILGLADDVVPTFAGEMEPQPPPPSPKHPVLIPNDDTLLLDRRRLIHELSRDALMSPTEIAIDPLFFHTQYGRGNRRSRWVAPVPTEPTEGLRGVRRLLGKVDPGGSEGGGKKLAWVPVAEFGGGPSYDGRNRTRAEALAAKLRMSWGRVLVVRYLSPSGWVSGSVVWIVYVRK